MKPPDPAQLALFDQTARNASDLTAPPALHRNPRHTEVAAAARIKPSVNDLRRKVEEWLKSAGPYGMTAKEGAALLAAERGLHPCDARCRNSVAPRLTELSQAGLAVATRHKREGAIAWRHRDVPADSA